MYQANLTAFITDIRLTYGSELLFIVSRLSDGQTDLDPIPLATIRAAQTAVATAAPLTSLVDTDGFGMKADALHFDATGQQQLGKAASTQLLNFYPFTTLPTTAVLGNGDYQLTVADAFPGFLYTLQTSTTLQADSWVDGEPIAAASQPVIFTYTPAVDDDRRFFRVSRAPAP